MCVCVYFLCHQDHPKKDKIPACFDDDDHFITIFYIDKHCPHVYINIFTFYPKPQHCQDAKPSRMWSDVKFCVALCYIIFFRLSLILQQVSYYIHMVQISVRCSDHSFPFLFPSLISFPPKNLVLVSIVVSVFMSAWPGEYQPSPLVLLSFLHFLLRRFTQKKIRKIALRGTQTFTNLCCSSHIM